MNIKKMNKMRRYLSNLDEIFFKYITQILDDADAFENSSLKQLNEALPFPYHWVGDASYTGTEYLIIPYAGSDLHISCPPQEWFNFWHSQIRITIERIFIMEFLLCGGKSFGPLYNMT